MAFESSDIIGVHSENSNIAIPLYYEINTNPLTHLSCGMTEDILTDLSVVSLPLSESELYNSYEVPAANIHRMVSLLPITSGK